MRYDSCSYSALFVGEGVILYIQEKIKATRVHHCLRDTGIVRCQCILGRRRRNPSGEPIRILTQVRSCRMIGVKLKRNACNYLILMHPKLGICTFPIDVSF